MIPAGRGVSLQMTPAEVSRPSLPWTHTKDSLCLAKCQHLVKRDGGKGRNLPQASRIANRENRHINHMGKSIEMVTVWLWKQTFRGRMASAG